MRRQREIDLITGQSQDASDWLELSPEKAVRYYRCKSYKVRRPEIYPSVQPAISKCSRPQSHKYWQQAVEGAGCERHFNMERDDILAAWKQSPHKHTLSCYGIGGGDDLQFNQLLSKCLRKSTVGTEKRPRKPKQQQMMMQQTMQTKQKKPRTLGLVLNRLELQAKLQAMPTVQRQLKASNAFSSVYCPTKAKAAQKLCIDAPTIELKSALGMQKSKRKQRFPLRRKTHKYCELQCGIPENDCTAQSWQQYKQQPKPYEQAFELEQQQQQLRTTKSEPCTYDELYKELVSCFVQNPKPDCCQLLYEKCCGALDRGDGEGGGGDGADGGADDGGAADSDEIDYDAPRGPRPPLHKPKKPGNYGDGAGDGDGDDGHGGGKGGKGGKGDGDGGKGKKGFGDDGDGGKGKKGFGDDDEYDGDDRKKKKSDDDDSKRGGGDGKDKTKIKFDPDKDHAYGTDGKDGDGDKSKDGGDGGDRGGSKGDGDGKDGDGTDGDGADGDKTKDGGSDDGKKKKKKRRHKKDGDRPKRRDKTKKGGGEKPIKPCPCEPCECMQGRKPDPDTPLIREMKEQDKLRQLRDNYKRLGHREYIKCRKPVYAAPQHKCDAIDCSNCFCSNPKLGDYCDCLQAMRELQQLLGANHEIKDNTLNFDLDDVRKRICQRFRECLCV
ncbi:uncharacterized protein LOC108607530 [Drosophila busckii]|uniref:uncharacterized protein LOC108607530 n=1 Tax=Drosophila busckii TaxID=30019 RepID=UPI00083EBBA4|nr:uncharacterized protein LOC108607530 [Drosophila busckii]